MRVKRINTQKIYNNAIDGANFSLSYNEDLSKGKILLREKEYIDFIPYEEVKLLDLDFAPGYYYFCISSVNTKETRNRTGDKVYTYEIDLMAQTKLLENYLLPSLAITPKTNGGLSIYTYLTRYNDLFGPKIRTESGFTNKFEFDQECQTKFADICPELQFNAPTLRECLTLLMQVKDCIPVVNNNVISFIDLSKKQRQQDINNKYIAYIIRSRSAEDFVSDIKVELKNVIQDGEYIECVENINFRNNDGNLVNDKTIALYTQHPIYDIKKFEIVYCYYTYWKDGDIEGGGKFYGTKDITSALLEKKEWMLKDINPDPDVVGKPENLKLYQNTSLYYERGTNKITNFELITKVGWFQITKTALHFIEQAVCDENPQSEQHSGFFLPGTINDPIWEKAIAFRITYKTKANVIAKLGKSQVSSVHREILDNQANNYVNAYTQGLLEYAKANRLGNQVKVINARYPRNYDMPLVGDYFNKNDIVFKADYQINANSVDATFYTCTNYVLRNYFTGINSKLRAWKIVDSSEAFYREEHKKLYLEFAYNQFIETNEFTNNAQEFMRYTLGSIDNHKLEFKSLYVRNYAMLQPDNYYVLECARNVIGNSVVFTFGFEDNYAFAMYINDKNLIGGWGQKMYSYTDENGQYEKMSISLVKDYKLYNNPIFDSSERHAIDDPDVQVFMSKLPELPKMIYETKTLFGTIELKHYKDNKEIIKQNLQFEYCADDDIYLGDEFMKGQINNIHDDLVLRISDVAPDGNILPEGTDYAQYWLVDPSEEFTHYHNTILLKVQDSVPMSDNQYAYIYNRTNNNILLAWKGREIHLNLIKERDKTIYAKNGDNEWVDKNI